MNGGPATARSLPCDAVREALPGHVAGEGDAAERAAITAHVAGCGACHTEASEATRVRALLCLAAPAPTPAAGGFARLAAAIANESAPKAAAGVRAAGPARWRIALPLGVAAAALVAATLTLGRGYVPLQPVATLVEGTWADGAPSALSTGSTVTAGPNGATLGAPGRFTCTLRAGTGLVADGPGALRLVRGAMVLHVVPGGAGCTVATRDARVQVLGTVLAVEADDAGTDVAVFAGHVRVEGGVTPATVEAGQALRVARGGTAALAATPAPVPAWLARGPVPRVRIPGGDRVADGACWCPVVLENPGPGLCAVLAPNVRAPVFSVTVTSLDAPGAAPVVLQRVTIRGDGARPPVEGVVWLGPGERYLLQADLTPGMPASGRYRVTARYAAPAAAPAPCGIGNVESAPVEFAVRR